MGLGGVENVTVKSNVVHKIIYREGRKTFSRPFLFWMINEWKAAWEKHEEVFEDLPSVHHKLLLVPS